MREDQPLPKEAYIKSEYPEYFSIFVGKKASFAKILQSEEVMAQGIIGMVMDHTLAIDHVYDELGNLIDLQIYVDTQKDERRI